jgi:hypothetical protein
LNGRKLKATPKTQQVLLLTANYDYINNQAFFYGAQSVRLNLFSENNLTPKIKLNTSGGAGLIILAAVPDGIIHMDRYYDYCWGLGFDIGASIQFDNHFFYNINYKGALLKTFEGNASHYWLHTVTSEIGYKFLNKFSIFAEPGHFDLKTYYHHYPDITRTYPYFKISARYNINIK